MRIHTTDVSLDIHRAGIEAGGVGVFTLATAAAAAAAAAAAYSQASERMNEYTS